MSYNDTQAYDDTEHGDEYSGGNPSKSLVADAKMRLNFFGGTAIKEHWKGTILPAFDTTRITNPLDTEAFIDSVAPCWTQAEDGAAPRHFLPSGWSRKLLVYTFLGESNTHFLSPRCRKNFVQHRDYTDMDLADPFDDIRYFVKNNKGMSESQKKALLDRRREGQQYIDSPVPQAGFRHMLFSEYWSQRFPTPKVELMGLTSSAYKHLIEQMRWKADSKYPSLGKTFTDYLLGDPYDPEGALVWFPTKRVMGDFGEANVMAFTHQPELPAGAERRPIGREALRQRFLLGEEANWSISSYQDMVDFAVNELTDVPLEIIKRACGSRADVGERSASTNRSAGVNSDVYDPMEAAAAAERYSSPATPPGVTPAAVPTAVPVVPATAAAPTYTAGVGGGAPQQYTLAQLAELFAARPDALVVVDGEWKALATSGLIPATVVPVTVPAVPAIPTVPMVPIVPQVVVTPVTLTTPAVAPGTDESVDTYRRKVCADERYARLTPSGKVEIDDLASKLWDNRGTSGGGMTAELMQRVTKASRQDYLG